MSFTDPRPLAERSLPAAGGPDLSPDGQRPARTVTVNLGESALSWLHARGHLSDRQFDAGEKLREDYERASLGPRVTMRWDAGAVTGGRGGRHAPDPALGSLSAKAQFDDALAALGQGLADVAWRVICANEALGAAERSLGWPARSGKLVLGLALDRLAEHYRLPG